MNTIDELLYYCHEIEPVGALLLTGEWGCGKTYLIDHQLKDSLAGKAIVVRVTLFGISSAEEIHSAIKAAWMSEYCKEKGIDSITDKIGSAKETVAKLEFLPEWVRKIASTDATAFLPIGNKLDGKNVILVFDDLERCCMNMVDVLGIINDYCENQKYHTIIVANQEKITQQTDDHPILTEVKLPSKPENPQVSQDNIPSVTINHFNETKTKLSYQEIKEKIIQRTTRYVPDYSAIVHTVISDMKYENDDYKAFLLECEAGLLELFAPDRDAGTNTEKDDRPHNIRSLKCAVQDFYRVYKELKNNEIPNISRWLYSFTSYLIAYKANIVQEDQYGTLFSDDRVRKLYPAYQSQYMLNSAKQWILHGTWDIKDVCEEIELTKKREMPLEPWESIRLNRIMDIEEDILQEGFDDFLSHAYNGNLTLNDYVLFIENTAWAEEDKYKLPHEIDWGKIELGIKKQIEEIKKVLPDRPPVSQSISESDKDYFSPEAWSAYLIIDNFRKSDALMFHRNRKLYIEQIGANLSSGFVIVQNKRFDTFSNEMAEITAQAFIKANNTEKRTFILLFKKMWESNLQSPDIIKDDCILGLKKLVLLLEENLRALEGAPRTYSIIHTEKFIKAIHDLIDTQTTPDSVQ